MWEFEARGLLLDVIKKLMATDFGDEQGAAIKAIVLNDLSRHREGGENGVTVSMSGKIDADGGSHGFIVSITNANIEEVIPERKRPTPVVKT